MERNISEPEIREAGGVCQPAGYNKLASPCKADTEKCIEDMIENPNDNSPVAEDPTGVIGNIIWKMLEEHFRGALVFDPIVVEVKTDHEGDDYIHTYIVFHGDFDKLDHDWTMQLSGKLWPRAEKLGYPAIPIQSFVAKSEWKQLLRMLGKKEVGT